MQHTTILSQKIELILQKFLIFANQNDHDGGNNACNFLEKFYSLFNQSMTIEQNNE